MRILFGPEHDGLHIDPNAPNGYEWWYFDAISDDERYVLVVIFFLGTPMSPYYKAVVDGKNPLPKDWCGVFLSLHERTDRGYEERAYTYNVYRESWGELLRNGSPEGLNDFRDKPLDIRLGDAKLEGRYSHDGRRLTHHWSISLNESNLWSGTTRADLTFAASFLLNDQFPIESEDEGHNWVCVAPACRVQGTITAAGNLIDFSGSGYHDHNFGVLPWSQTRSWLWGRANLTSQSGSPLHTVFYWNHEVSVKPQQNPGAFLMLLDSKGRVVHQTTSADGGDSYAWGKRSGKYGLKSVHGIDLQSETTGTDGVTSGNLLQVPLFSSFLSESPFYERGVSPFKLSIEKNGEEIEYTGTGLAEVFEPARLCGPIISRMMWTRIRRRS